MLTKLNKLVKCTWNGVGSYPWNVPCWSKWFQLLSLIQLAILSKGQKKTI